MALRRQQAAKIMCLSLSLNFLDQKVQKRYRDGCLSQGKSVAKENKILKKLICYLHGYLQCCVKLHKIKQQCWRNLREIPAEISVQSSGGLCQS